MLSKAEAQWLLAINGSIAHAAAFFCEAFLLRSSFSYLATSVSQVLLLYVGLSFGCRMNSYSSPCVGLTQAICL